MSSSNSQTNLRILPEAGALTGATRAWVLLHGRGGDALSMQPLAEHFLRGGEVAMLPQSTLPHGPGFSWYPHSFMAREDDNQPALDNALSQLARVVTLANTKGISDDRIVFVGFSQGACLACEYVARNPRRYGGLIAFTGALIRGTAQGRPPQGSVEGTKVILVSSDPDPHVPVTRVEETARYFEQLSANVSLKLLPGAPHQITQEALAFVAQQRADFATSSANQLNTI